MNNVKTEHPAKGTVLKNLTPILSIPGRYEVADGNGGVVGEMSGLVQKNLPDGIEIIGNGTLQHPMDVVMSPVYKSAPAGLWVAMKVYIKLLMTPSESWRAQNQDSYVDLRQFIATATDQTSKFTQELFERLAMDVKYHDMSIDVAIAEAQQAIKNNSQLD